MCVLFVCTLLKVLSYYDLSVLSMSVMGFQQNKSLESTLILDVWNVVNFAEPLVVKTY